MPYHFLLRWPRRSPSWCRSRQHSGVTTTPGTQWLRHQTDWCRKVQQGCLPSSSFGVLPSRFCVRSPLCQDISSRRQTLFVAALATSWQDKNLAHRLMKSSGFTSKTRSSVSCLALSGISAKASGLLPRSVMGTSDQEPSGSSRVDISSPWVKVHGDLCRPYVTQWMGGCEIPVPWQRSSSRGQ